MPVRRWRSIGAATIASLLLFQTPANARGVSVNVRPSANGLTIDAETNLRKVLEIQIAIDGVEVVSCGMGSAGCAYQLNTGTLSDGVHTAQVMVIYREPHSRRRRHKASTVTFNTQGNSQTNPSGDPPQGAVSEPLIQSSNLVYLGAFLLPDFATGSHSSGLEGSWGTGAFNPAGNGGRGSLFLVDAETSAADLTRPAGIAEISLATPVPGVVTTGTTTKGSNIITNMATTTGVAAGWSIAGAGIPTGATVSSVGPGSRITISQTATATASGVSLIINSLNNLNTATTLQNFADPTNGTIGQIGPLTTGYVTGHLVHNGRLYTSAAIYYDAGMAQTLSHWVGPLNLSTISSSTVLGPYQLGQTSWPNAGFLDGAMEHIPTEWQALLGGPAFAMSPTGISIVDRQSTGPSFAVFDPSNIGSVSPVPVTQLLWYSNGTVSDLPNGPGAHPTLGNWIDNTAYYDNATELEGAVFPSGWRTVLYFGRKSLGNFCYGEGTSNSTPQPYDTAHGVAFCYDPAVSSKGPHTYYNYYNGPAITTTATSVAGQTTLTNIPSTAGLIPGMSICGEFAGGCPAGGAYTIVSVDSTSQITVNTPSLVTLANQSVKAYGVQWQPVGAAGYIYYVWAYDAKDLLAVKNGTKHPWDIIPYATWPLYLPFAPTPTQSDQAGQLGLAAYDPATHRIYLVQKAAAPGGGGPNALPVIHIFQVQ